MSLNFKKDLHVFVRVAPQRQKHPIGAIVRSDRFLLVALTHFVRLHAKRFEYLLQISGQRPQRPNSDRILSAAPSFDLFYSS
jgi:hypothetical protein